jgi:hypothetical protein
MTTYPATNLQLTYDNATNQWNFTEVAYDYGATPPPSWSGYTGDDPAYEYAPENGGDNGDGDTDTDPCPPGYMYDETLKQCIINPNYQAPAYAGEPGGGDDRRDEPEFLEFDASTPEGRKSMYEHGLEHDYFTTDTSKGGAYEFQGAKKAPDLTGVWGQFGEDRQYDRYINELAREDAKRKAAGQSPILAQAVGFFGLAKSFKNWGNYAMDVAANIHDTTTGLQETTKTVVPTIPGPTDYPWAGAPGTTVPQPQASPGILAEERKQEIHTEKVNQEREKTEQEKIKTDRERQERVEKRQVEKETGTGGSFGRDEDRPVIQPSEPKRSYGPAGGPHR